MFRPGFILPMKGIHSKTKLYDIPLMILKPFYPILNILFSKQVTDTIKIGQAMINSIAKGYSETYLENKDINKLAGQTDGKN